MYCKCYWMNGFQTGTSAKHYSTTVLYWKVLIINSSNQFSVCLATIFIACNHKIWLTFSQLTTFFALSNVKLQLSADWSYKESLKSSDVSVLLTHDRKEWDTLMFEMTFEWRFLWSFGLAFEWWRWWSDGHDLAPWKFWPSHVFTIKDCNAMSILEINKWQVLCRGGGCKPCCYRRKFLVLCRHAVA
jgi:hypothetical protein